MKKLITLTDNSKRRFNIENAAKYNSNYEYDRENIYYVCKATKKLWEHETLYHLEGNVWLRHFRNDWNATERWEEISECEAIAWIKRNTYTTKQRFRKRLMKSKKIPKFSRKST